MNSHETFPEEQAGDTPARQGPVVTVWASVTATRSLLTYPGRLDQVLALIQSEPVRATKTACRLLSGCEFGTLRNASGSLRHAANVKAVWGVEGDIDKGLVPIAEVVARLRAAGIAAIVFTTPSHTAAAPRCRVLVPLSAAVAPALRHELVSLLNGALGGILAPESWVLSQPFYFGRVAGVEYELHVVEGQPLDVVAYIPSFDPIGPPALPERAAPLTTQTRVMRLVEMEESDPVLRRLVDRGMVKSRRADGGFNIVCPAAEEHTTESSETATIYNMAHTGGFALGNIHCMHGHCRSRAQSDHRRRLDFDEVSQDFADLVTPDGRPRFTPIAAAAFAAGAPPAWVVRGVLPAAELAMVYGESGAGKSFLVLDVVMAVARGVPWRGLAVRQGPVIYVAAEGAGGFRKRLAAYAAHSGIDLATVPLCVVPECPSLLGEDGKALAQAIQGAGGAAVIVIDTLAQVSAGGNENSGEDMGKVLAHCKLLHRVTGALVVLVHHAGKDATKGARGWSGVRAAVDAEIEVSRGVACRTARVTKQKDADDSAVFNFNLCSVMVGADEDGEISSCVVEHVDLPVKVRKPAGPLQQRVLRQFHDLAFEGQVSLAALVAAAVGAEPKPDGHDRRRELVRRAIDKLNEGAFFRVDGDLVADPSPVPTTTPVPTSGRLCVVGTAR